MIWLRFMAACAVAFAAIFFVQRWLIVDGEVPVEAFVLPLSVLLAVAIATLVHFGRVIQGANYALSVMDPDQSRRAEIIRAVAQDIQQREKNPPNSQKEVGDAIYLTKRRRLFHSLRVAASWWLLRPPTTIDAYASWDPSVSR